MTAVLASVWLTCMSQELHQVEPPPSKLRGLSYFKNISRDKSFTDTLAGRECRTPGRECRAY